MQYYVSKTTVEIVDGRVTGYEEVMTKPDSLRVTRNSLRRLSAIGIENLHLCEHPKNSRRYGKLVKAATQRRKAKKITKADLAKMIEDFDKEFETNEND